MKDYKKPEAMYVSETSEGVYMASGNDEEVVKRCRFGRTEANPGADTCQVCSYSGGTRDKELPLYSEKTIRDVLTMTICQKRKTKLNLLMYKAAALILMNHYKCCFFILSKFRQHKEV